MPFPVTHWSVLALASLHGDTQARAALEAFFGQYRAPLAEFVRYQRVPSGDIEDVVQDFLLHIAQDSVLRRADQGRGRFRTFLLGALKRFLYQRRVHAQAAKRGSGREPMSLDLEDREALLETAVTVHDARHFDRHWAVSLLDAAMSEVAREYSQRNREKVFEAVTRFLPGPEAPPTYEEGAEAAGMSLAQFKTEVHRVRARLRDRLRLQVGRTVSAPHEVEEEFRYLGRVLMGTHAQGNEF